MSETLSLSRKIILATPALLIILLFVISTPFSDEINLLLCLLVALPGFWASVYWSWSVNDSQVIDDPVDLASKAELFNISNKNFWDYLGSLLPKNWTLFFFLLYTIVIATFLSKLLVSNIEFLIGG